MNYEQISISQRGPTLLITLDRPERLNAWTPVMSGELADAVDFANHDAGIGAIVVTGAGRGFCSGADIGANFAPPTEPATEPASQHSEDDPFGMAWVSICRSAKPMIAAINGPAIGVGLSLVLPFDRIIAARKAKISARFVRLGLVPELAASHFLVARCGWGAASWLALTGTTIDGEEAGRIGLADRVVDDDAVLESALTDAELLATGPHRQVRMIKRLLTLNANESDLDVVQQRELVDLLRCYRMAEHHEAVNAFLERREPKFQ